MVSCLPCRWNLGNHRHSSEDTGRTATTFGTVFLPAELEEPLTSILAFAGFSSTTRALGGTAEEIFATGLGLDAEASTIGMRRSAMHAASFTAR